MQLSVGSVDSVAIRYHCSYHEAVAGDVALPRSEWATITVPTKSPMQLTVVLLMSSTYLCPEGQRLPFRGLRRKNGKVRGPFRVYRASRTVCRACPAYGVCTKDVHSGRALWIGPSDALLRQHRHWMTTERARRLYARRKGLIEPIFGILKEQLGARRFLLRGLLNVRAEFTLLATAFNLRTLWKVWRTDVSQQRIPSV